LIFQTRHEITFAHTSFKWANLASHNAGVTVAIIGLSNHPESVRRLFSIADDGTPIVKETSCINAYLISWQNVIVEKASMSLSGLAEMKFGNKPVDDGHLLLSSDEVRALNLSAEQHVRFIRRIYGSTEFINGSARYCLWIEDHSLDEAMCIEPIRKRIESVRAMRLISRKSATVASAGWAHRFQEIRQQGTEIPLIVPCHSSENREYLPVGFFHSRTVISNAAFALYDAPLWNMALIASRLHLVWIGTVCGKLKTDFRYSNTLGWNTFPVPLLTEQNKTDLTHCAEEILLAREAHFPATIADLYEPDKMPDDLRRAHDRNDEVLERIYIGRRFRNDTERLEKLFDLYSKMTAPRAGR